jgi:DNA polymerase zeta
MLKIVSEGRIPPPGAIISARKIMNDARAEPQYGERVPYLVRTGAPGARVVDRVVSPEEMMVDQLKSPFCRI